MTAVSEMVRPLPFAFSEIENNVLKGGGTDTLWHFVARGGALAQEVEHFAGNRKVAGSIPGSS